MTIESLIEKLEKAEEGSEDLDREINEALGWKHLPPYKLGLRRFKERWIKGIETSWFVPRYTTSVDEALTLFYKEGDFHIELILARSEGWRVTLGNDEAGAKTLALVICALSFTVEVKNDT